MNEFIELDIKKLLANEYLFQDDYFGDKVYAKKENYNIEGYDYSVYFQFGSNKPQLYLECEMKVEMVNNWKIA